MTAIPTVERGREPKVYSGSRGRDANTVIVRRSGSTSQNAVDLYDAQKCSAAFPRQAKRPRPMAIEQACAQ
jgi:hypothetical protein